MLRWRRDGDGVLKWSSESFCPCSLDVLECMDEIVMDGEGEFVRELRVKELTAGQGAGELDLCRETMTEFGGRC